jgi:DNA-binding SARP family transcriptional activator
MPSEVWVDAIADPPVGEPLPEGELIPELDDDWLDVEREQYRRRQLTRLAALARNAEAAGDNLDAARWAAERCRLAPLDESAHRELLRLMGTNGNVAAAVLEGRFAERLCSELGSIPPRPPGRHRQRAGAGPATRTPLFGRSLSCAICSTSGARQPEVAVRWSC